MNHTLNSFYIGGWKEKSAELVRADLSSSVFKIKTDERRDAGFQIAESLLGLTPPDPGSDIWGG